MVTGATLQTLLGLPLDRQLAVLKGMRVSKDPDARALLSARVYARKTVEEFNDFVNETERHHALETGMVWRFDAGGWASACSLVPLMEHVLGKDETLRQASLLFEHYFPSHKLHGNSFATTSADRKTVEFLARRYCGEDTQRAQQMIEEQGLFTLQKQPELNGQPYLDIHFEPHMTGYSMADMLERAWNHHPDVRFRQQAERLDATWAPAAESANKPRI